MSQTPKPQVPREVLNRWDALSRAIGAMQCATPALMSAASSRVDEAKAAFESALFDSILDKPTGQ